MARTDRSEKDVSNREVRKEGWKKKMAITERSEYI